MVIKKATGEIGDLMKKYNQCPKCGSKRLAHCRYIPFLVWREDGEEKRIEYSRSIIEVGFRCIDCGHHEGKDL